MTSKNAAMAYLQTISVDKLAMDKLAMEALMVTSVVS